MTLYTRYNGRMKAEMLDTFPFSLTSYREAETINADWQALANRAQKVYDRLPAEDRDAFFQLVLYAVKASANVNALYFAAQKNKLYAEQGRAATNDLAAEVKSRFQEDADLTDAYNHKLAGGKWDHMMDQAHIGYTIWQDPPANKMPKAQTIDLPPAAQMGVAVEGTSDSWPGSASSPALPQFDVYNQQKDFIDVFDKGQAAFDFTATPSAPWIVVSQTHGSVAKETRLWVSIDWRKAHGAPNGTVAISQAGGPTVNVQVTAFNPPAPQRESVDGFVETNGYVAMEAAHFTKKTDAGGVSWEEIPNYGRTDSAMSIFPVTAPSATPGESPCLTYKMYLFDTGTANVTAILAPTLNFVPGRGLRFAVSLDDQAPQVVDALA